MGCSVRLEVLEMSGGRRSLERRGQLWNIGVCCIVVETSKSLKTSESVSCIPRAGQVNGLPLEVGAR